MSDTEKFVVVAHNANNQLQAFGTPSGRPFLSEEQAEKWAKRIEARMPHLDCIALPIFPMPEEIQ